MVSDILHILLYDSLYQSQFLFLETVVLNHLQRKDREFGFFTVFRYMDMYWRMVVCIEHESVTEEYEYCWHTIFFCKNR